MNILIINGNPSAERRDFDDYLAALETRLGSAGHQVRALRLRDLSIKPCTGCFACWVKTPGLCSIKDDGVTVSKLYIAAEHVILASPLIMGFPSALLKNAMDRNIPLVHPHLEEVGGEVHHLKRYDRYPDISFVLARESFTDDEDIAICTDIFKRESINVRASLGFVKFVDQPVEEVLHAIAVH